MQCGNCNAEITPVYEIVDKSMLAKDKSNLIEEIRMHKHHGFRVKPLMPAASYRIQIRKKSYQLGDISLTY